MSKLKYFLAGVAIAVILEFWPAKEQPWVIEITSTNRAIMVDRQGNIRSVRLPRNWRQAEYPDADSYESLHYW